MENNTIRSASPGREPFEQEIDLFELWAIVWRFKVLILGVAFMITAGAVAYAFIVPPVYRAEVLLSPVEEDIDAQAAFIDTPDMFWKFRGMMVAGSEQFSKKEEEELALLKSRVFLLDVIRSHSLQRYLFPEQWDVEKNAWMVGLEDVPSDEEVYRKLADGVVSYDKKRDSKLIHLYVDWTDPALAAEWANLLVGELNRYVKTVKMKQARKDLTYLEQQLQQTSSAANREILNAMIETAVRRILLTNTTDEIAFKVIDPAMMPDKRHEPERKKIVLIGLILGFGVGGMMAFVLHMREEHIKNTVSIDPEPEGELRPVFAGR